MSLPQGPTCPGCGEPAALFLTMQSDCFCGNEDCIFKWDPSRTLEELAADVHWIRLQRDD